MIKGVNRTIIEVNPAGNRYFERALLFVRPSLETVSNQHLRLQADRFVETVGTPPIAGPTQKERRRKRRQKGLILASFWWLTGLACGILLMILL